MYKYKLTGQLEKEYRNAYINFPNTGKEEGNFYTIYLISKVPYKQLIDEDMRKSWLDVHSENIVSLKIIS